MLSVAAVQENVAAVGRMLLALRFDGGDGGSLSLGAVEGSVSLSAFGPPFAVVAVVRILFTPAVSCTVAVAVFHVVHAPVPGKSTGPGKSTVPLSPPSTISFTGRLSAVPLA